LTPVFRRSLGAGAHRAGSKKLRKLVSGAGDILIAPSFIIRLPLYAELEKLDCSIKLIEVSRSAGAAATTASNPSEESTDSD
jgi:hypothetical protein